MLYSRRCLEVIITDLCECELKRPRKTEPLKGIIDKLNSEEKVPSHIITSMLNLNSMSIYGAHPKEFDPEQVKPVLNNLTTIIKWYLKYNDSKIISKSTSEEAKHESNDPDDARKIHGKFKNRSIILFSGLLLGVIFIALIVYFYVGNGNRNSKNGQEELQKTIAVLPFENMSDNEELSWFGDAITDEIIQQLYKIKEFIVRSRPSVMQYKQTTKTTPEIGKELKVNYLIAGSAQRSEDQVRIRVQLINAVKDIELWGETFEGNRKDLLSIQSEIAKQIADKLKTVLSPEEIIRIDKKSTENAEALDSYLQGNDYYLRGYAKQDLEIASKLYRKAIESDPDFALAYVRLSICILTLHWFYYDPSMDRVAESKEAIDKAFMIDPNLPDAHLALGLYYYWGFLNYAKALDEITLAQKQLHNNSECFFSKGNIYLRAGEWSLAKENHLKAFELDPCVARIAHNVGVTFSLLGEYQEAEKYFEKAILLNPTLIESIWQKSFLYMKWKGNTIQSRETLTEAFQFKECLSNPLLIESTVLIDIFDGKYQEALSYLASKDIDFIFVQFYINLKSMLYARIYDLMNKPGMADKYFNSARIAIDSMILKNPEDPRLYSTLGIAYAGLGQKEKAIEAGEKGMEMMPINKEAYRGVFRAEDLARIYVMVGEYEKALDLIKNSFEVVC
jgi:serine/threonine-protein kinase